MFAYINYDYATEFGVYAHSSPVPKQIVADLMYLAERHPDGMNMKIAYDDDSSWPMLWYLRDFSNKIYFWGTAEDARNRAPDIEGSVAIIVANRKNAEIERILGKDYYRFDLIRLWWPMQEYFNLSYQRIANVFKSDAENPAASLYRKGIWDIWWSRDYDRYAQAMCVEDKVRLECRVGDGDEQRQRQCAQNARVTCERTADRFNVEKWPVSDELFLYIRKDFAVQIWDAGLNGLTVAERLIPDPEDAVYRDLTAMQSFGSGTLNGPRGLAIDNQGNIYVADTNNSRIVVFDPQGEVLREIGTGILREPWGLAVNPVDNYLYVADTWNFRVAVFTLSGDLVHTFGEGGVDSSLPYAFYGPRAIAIDREGLIYVADTGFHRIRVYDTNWQHLRDIVTNGAGLNNQPEPVCLAIHPVSGELYIAETWNQRISVFRRDGPYVTGWSVNMWAGTRDSLNRPFLTISPDGTLILVSDMDASDDNNGPRVVAYDLRGNPVVAFNAPLIPSADGTGGPTGVEVVGGLVYGPQGQLYVADALTSRILVFPPLGVTGSLSPVPDPTYGGDAIGSSVMLGDEEAVQRVGYAYWQALTTGDYELFKALHCPEDQAAADFPVDSTAFINFKAGPYLGASIRELAVFPGVNENQATLSWGGWLIFRPGTEQESRTGVSYVPLILVKRAGVWKICANPSTQSDNIFRPGGG
jgi:DNA-binding beta-propeller fold protein YncE